MNKRKKIDENFLIVFIYAKKCKKKTNKTNREEIRSIRNKSRSHTIFKEI
jgi:hypothetical protein